jgi:ribonuclease VapC
MIVVDSSAALLAIFEGEPDAATFATAIAEADRLLISAVNVYETGIVLRVRHGDEVPARLWRFLLEDNDFEIIPFDQRQAHEALTAFGRFGKGLNPRARLNLADCAAYALAKSMNLPLPFKGDDLTHTDVQISRT